MSGSSPPDRQDVVTLWRCVSDDLPVPGPWLLPLPGEHFKAPFVSAEFVPLSRALSAERGLERAEAEVKRLRGAVERAEDRFAQVECCNSEGRCQKCIEIGVEGQRDALAALSPDREDGDG